MKPLSKFYLLLALLTLLISCKDNPQFPFELPDDHPNKDGKMWVIVTNERPESLLAFYFSKGIVSLPVEGEIDSAWGENLLENPLEQNELDTVLSFTPENLTKNNMFMYELEGGMRISRIVNIYGFEDLMNIDLEVK